MQFIHKYIFLLVLILSQCWLLHSQQTTWKRSLGTEGFHTAALDVYRKDPDTLYAIGFNVSTPSSVGKIIISTNAGKSWDSLIMGGTDYGSLAIDPNDSQRFFISAMGFDQSSNNVLMTVDGGRTWRLLFRGHGYIAPVIEIDPVNPAIVYAGHGPGILSRSIDRGETWFTFENLQAGWLTSLAISHVNDSMLYIAGIGGGIYKSSNWGESWSLLPTGFSVDTWTTIALHPTDMNTVYVAMFSDQDSIGGVYKSSDGGLNWKMSNNGLGKKDRDATTIEINPKNAEELFLGLGSDAVGNGILFKSTDSGQSWINFSNGLPDSGSVTSIVIDTFYNKLYVGVAAGESSGVYILDETLSADEPLSLYPVEYTLNQNYPNPFNSKTIIQYTVPTREFVTLLVFDVMGREVQKLVSEIQEMGKYETMWDANDLPSGVYFYHLKIGDNTASKTTVLLK